MIRSVIRQLKENLALVCFCGAFLILLAPERMSGWTARRALEPISLCARPVSATAGALAGFGTGLISMWKAERENRQLRSELDAARNENLKLQQKVTLLETQLRSVTLLRRKIPDAKPLLVRVIGSNSSGLSRVVTVGAGAGDGLRPGQAVCLNGALLGRISQAGRWYGKVRLVTDADSRVAGFVQRSGAKCILKGTGAQECRLDYMPADADVRAGDVVLSAGVSPVVNDVGLPRGVPVARITSVERDARRPDFLRVEAEPLARTHGLETVEVILKDR